MTCEACIAASTWPSYLFKADCKGCQARMVARGPDFHRCRASGKQDGPYRNLLARAGVTHAEVVAAAAADKERAPA